MHIFQLYFWVNYRELLLFFSSSSTNRTQNFSIFTYLDYELQFEVFFYLLLQQNTDELHSMQWERKLIWNINWRIVHRLTPAYFRFVKYGGVKLCSFLFCFVFHKMKWPTFLKYDYVDFNFILFGTLLFVYIPPLPCTHVGFDWILSLMFNIHTDFLVYIPSKCFIDILCCWRHSYHHRLPTGAYRRHEGACMDSN